KENVKPTTDSSKSKSVEKKELKANKKDESSSLSEASKDTTKNEIAAIATKRNNTTISNDTDKIETASFSSSSRISNKRVHIRDVKNDDDSELFPSISSLSPQPNVDNKNK